MSTNYPRGRPDPRGRAGNPNADIYLVSPETAAATAIRGTFATAEEIMGEEVKILADVTEPEFYGIDDSMLIEPLPAEEAAKIEIKKGPNIKFLPVPEELSKDLKVPVSLKGGDNISTDDITPASAEFSSMRSNIPLMSQYCYTRYDADFSKRAKEMGRSRPERSLSVITQRDLHSRCGSSAQTMNLKLFLRAVSSASSRNSLRRWEWKRLKAE